MTGLPAAQTAQAVPVEADSPWPIVEAAFERAAGTPVDRRSALLRFAGKAVSLTVVGPALHRLVFPTFAHLIAPVDVAKEAADAQIRMWDCAATATPRPVTQASAGWQSGGDGWRTAAYANYRYLCEERQDSAIWFDRAKASLVMAAADARQVSASDGARPLQRTMSEFCRALGVQDVHAGLVSHNGCGVLIVGGSGRGKTTTSIDGFHGGLDFLGDDTVGIGEAVDGGVIGYSVYGSARVLPEQTERWPDLARHWSSPGPGEDKAILFPVDAHPGRAAAETRIVAIASPVVGSGRMAVERASPREAFRALVRDSRPYQLRFGMQSTDFTRLARLTTALPCYRFELDREPARVADGLRQMIAAGSL